MPKLLNVSGGPSSMVVSATIVGAASTSSRGKELAQLFGGGAQQKPEQAIGFWMWRLTLAFQRRSEAALREIGTTHLQFVILTLAAWLNHTTEQVSQRDLVEISGVQEAQVSLMVKVLRAKKLITQKRSTTDSRVRLIVVTAAGVRLLSEAIPIMTAIQAEMWPPGVETDRLLRLFATTLKRWEADNA